jgi:phosphoribosylglycinamide formyltransferase 1
MKSKRTRVGIFASGEGSNAEALIRSCAEDSSSIEVVAVFCDNPQAGVIARAERLGVSLVLVPYKREPEQTAREAKAQHEAVLLEHLRARQVEWVFLAGYQRILSEEFLRHFWDQHRGINRVVNIHPSLLPQFPGKDAYEQAFAAGVTVAGVTVHYVDGGIDTGKIIAQKEFLRLGSDDLATFKQRGLAVEHQLYPQVLKQLITYPAPE